jgi:preprotein translocase subunit SecD
VTKRRRIALIVLALGAALLIGLSSFFWLPPLRYYVEGLLTPANYEQVLSVRPSRATEVTPEMLTMVMKAYSRRLRALDVPSEIKEQPPDRLVVRMTLPGIPTDASRDDYVRPHFLTKHLTLNVVHEESDKLIADSAPVPDGFEILSDGTSRFVVSKNPLLEDAIEDANATDDVMNGGGAGFAVEVQLTNEATRDLSNALAKVGPFRLAFVLDGAVIIALPVLAAPSNNSMLIMGLPSHGAADDLATTLRSGGMPWPIFLESGRFLK